MQQMIGDPVAVVDYLARLIRLQNLGQFQKYQAKGLDVENVRSIARGYHQNRRGVMSSVKTGLHQQRYDLLILYVL